MKIKNLGVLLLVLGMVIAGFVVAEIKNGMNVGKAEAQPAGTGGNVLYVGGSGPNNYTKIQDAINAANDGDTIFVYNGTYYENVIIDKSINLIGKDKHNTIIDANYKGDVVRITKDNVKLSNFTIKNSEKNFEKAGIVIHADNVVIENNIIADNGDQGIRIFSSNHNIIRNNIISNNVYYGIWLYNSRENLIIDNSFINDGLVMREGSYPSFIQTIMNNTVNGKPLYYYLNKKDVSIPEDAGQIILVNCSHITVKNFSISNASIGLEIAYSSFIKILNNNFSNNNLNGIRLYYSENNEISYNILYKNGWGGLSLWYSSNNSVSHNDIGRNAYDDIEILFSSNGNKIFSNVVRDSIYGIGIRQSDGNIIHWNNIYNHEKYGMIAQDAKVNARWNWWGSFAGIIFGDKIAVKNGRIYSFPWLPFPNPLAD